MSKRPLRTTDLAYAVGVHPNTVRQYEAWGWIPPALRTSNGYRQFTEHHLYCIRLVRSCMAFTWLGGDIRHAAQNVFQSAAGQRFGGALQSAYQLSNLIQHERVQAETAARLVQRWAHGLTVDSTEKPLRIGEAARQAELTTDILRNWERDGLLEVPRDPKNGYRVYGTREISRLRIIRMLRHARYSSMAILRMLNQLDAGQRDDVLAALDVPEEGEDIHFATDRWLHTLSTLEPYAQDLIAQLEWILDSQVRGGLKSPGGRDMVLTFYKGVLLDVLEHVRAAPECWRLTGTMAAYLRGIFVPFRDIQIWVRDEAQVDRWAEMLADYPRHVVEQTTGEATVYLVEFLVRGVIVRISAMERPPMDAALSYFHERLWEGEDPMPCGNLQVPVALVELDALDALAQGKSNLYRPWLRYMKKHGYPHDLLSAGMQAYGISSALQAEIGSGAHFSVNGTGRKPDNETQS